MYCSRNWPSRSPSSRASSQAYCARNRENSLCCGAGGAQFWKEEEHGEKAVSVERFEEAASTGAETLAVGCPFCMQMFESAKSSSGGKGPVVKDVVELIAEGM